MTRELGDLVDLGDLGPEEEARVRRVHELLIAVGPPHELPAGLSEPPPTAEAVVVPLRRRRPAAVLLIAAAVAAACFGSGYLIADQAHTSAAAVRVVSMHSAGAQDSFASLRVGSMDAGGNWPIEFSVSGLPRLASQQARYFLMLMRDGKPSSLCGIFRVGKDGSATVTFSVPYAITKSTRFVVTEMAPGVQFPGHVVMTSS